jgi:hypothetical protein
MVDPERPRTWQEARERTLETWGELRGSIVDPDEVELLIGIHAACGLCQLSSDEKAAAIAEGRAEEGAIKCDFCPFYDQFGGCRTLNREMTDCVLEKDWRQLERLVDRFMDQTRRLEMPASWTNRGAPPLGGRSG